MAFFSLSSKSCLTVIIESPLATICRGRINLVSIGINCHQDVTSSWSTPFDLNTSLFQTRIRYFRFYFVQFSLFVWVWVLSKFVDWKMNPHSMVNHLLFETAQAIVPHRSELNAQTAISNEVRAAFACKTKVATHDKKNRTKHISCDCESFFREKKWIYHFNILDFPLISMWITLPDFRSSYSWRAAANIASRKSKSPAVLEKRRPLFPPMWI